MKLSASPEGTLQFRKSHERRSVAEGHFHDFLGLHFTTLGMGTYLGEPDEPTDLLVSEAVILSIKSGAVNVIDTAINYRHQKAERSVGRALKRLFHEGIVDRDQIFVSTKNGYLSLDADITMDPSTNILQTLVKAGTLDPEDVVQGIHCMSPPYLEDQLKRSLRNLGIEKIDLMYLHNPAESQLPLVGIKEFTARLRSAFEFYEKERHRGKIGYYGMATWSCFRVTPESPEYLNLWDIVKLAEDVGGKDHGFRFIQLPNNLAMPEALTLSNQKVKDETFTILQAAKMCTVGVFTSSPLLQGRLAFHPDLPLIKGLMSRSLTCLQFARSTPGVIAPLVGHKQPEHVKENLQIARIPPFTTEQFKEQFIRA